MVFFQILSNYDPGAYRFFIRKSLKIFFSETTGKVSTIFHRNVPWEVLFQIPSNYYPWPRPGAFKFFTGKSLKIFF